MPALVRLLVADELLAVRPVRIADRQPARRVGVEHLLGRDDLDLVRDRCRARTRAAISRDRRVVALEQVEVPVGAVGRSALIGCFLPEELAEHRIDLRRAADARASRSCRSARSTRSYSAHSGDGRSDASRRRQFQVRVIARRRQQLLAQEARAARRVGAERVAVGGLRRVDVPAVRVALARILSASSSAEQTTVPPERVSWKNVSSSTSSASSVWRMNTRSTSLVLARQEQVEQREEALGEVLLVLVHRRRHVHQAEHHRARDRLGPPARGCGSAGPARRGTGMPPRRRASAVELRVQRRRLAGVRRRQRPRANCCLQRQRISRASPPRERDAARQRLRHRAHDGEVRRARRSW